MCSGPKLCELMHTAPLAGRPNRAVMRPHPARRRAWGGHCGGHRHVTFGKAGSHRPRRPHRPHTASLAPKGTQNARPGLRRWIPTAHWAKPCGGCARAAAGKTRQRCWNRTPTLIRRRPWAGPRCSSSGACTRPTAGPRPRTRCASPRRSRKWTTIAGPRPASAANSPTRPPCWAYATGPTRHGQRSGRGAALLEPNAPGRALLDFRRGLLAGNLSETPKSARTAYRRAHAGATARGDLLLCSSTWRHLAGLAAREGELAEARHGFAESLRLREELGFLVGIAPALASLADVQPEPEATRLREEAGRLFRLLGGVPTWLADRLPGTERDAGPTDGPRLPLRRDPRLPGRRSGG